VDGLMMETQLTLDLLLGRAETLFPSKEVVSRRPDRTLVRTTYGEVASRSRRLAVALRRLGLERGDRVATLCWNHAAHLEAYFGVPAAGGVVHTLNPRLHADELAYITSHAGDRFALVDDTLVPVLESFQARAPFQRVLVAPEAYEELLAGADESTYEPLEPDEGEAAAMCYTSGTTGRPKAVVYSHRALVLHSVALAMVDQFAVCERDVVMPVVPMFHANGWGLPYVAPLVGAKLVLPGPNLDPASVLELLEAERVTLTAGVPTVWLGVLRTLDADPRGHDLSSLRTIVVGGAAAPRSLIEGFEERHGLTVVHAWGMTELTPLGTLCRVTSELDDAPGADRLTIRAKQGQPSPLLEIRARTVGGFAPWDGETMGELEVRGPWVASSYFESPEGADRFTHDGWFRTGDIVTIDPRGYVEIEDRAKDLIKSGGEWISSVALENALMGHPAVAEAAVIAVPNERWGERPLAVVVLAEGAHATADELTDFLAESFVKFQLPDAIEFADEIPKTAAGKFRKTALRERFSSSLETGAPPPQPGSARREARHARDTG
jgi:fatty-acyl-CoA synthase